MRITFVTRKFGNVERNSHCDVLHITLIRVARLFLDYNGDFAIKVYAHILASYVITAPVKSCSCLPGNVYIYQISATLLLVPRRYFDSFCVLVGLLSSFLRNRDYKSKTYRVVNYATAILYNKQVISHTCMHNYNIINFNNKKESHRISTDKLRINGGLLTILH